MYLILVYLGRVHSAGFGRQVLRHLLKEYAPCSKAQGLGSKCGTEWPALNSFLAVLPRQMTSLPYLRALFCKPEIIIVLTSRGC